MQKSVLEGKAFDVINPVSEDMPEPQFKKYKDAGSVMRTQSYMTHPIYNSEGDLFMTIQVMSKEKKNSKAKVKLYTGFTNFDEVFLAIFSAFIQTKMQQILAQMAQKRTEREVIATIDAASVIST